jgi:enoyl-CoA hydratase/carnithine racemase
MPNILVWRCAARPKYYATQMSMTHPRLATDGHVARIVLDRPERHNALGAEDLESFRAQLAAVEADESIRVLIVTGSGDTFCSGASLDQIESGEMSGRLFETLTEDLASVRVPTICALNGSVYGGGTEIALCCDFRIGVVGSRLSVPAARLGICYPASGLKRYVDSLGPGVTRRVMLAGEELNGDEMLRSGFLNRLVAPADLPAATHELASRLASLAPLAVQAMKRILRALSTAALDAAETRELVARCEGSEDLKEGLRARREGRGAEFRGR